MRFGYPRQQKAPYLCIADFFRPVDSGETDYAAFTIVTMGNEVTESANRLRLENKYQEYLVRHGMGVEMAEALAEHWHHRIREEWGFADEDGTLVNMLLRQHYRGGRYSWGYPACPELEDHETFFTVVPHDDIAVDLTEGYQLVPEQSTAAIVLHHPQARYFAVYGGGDSESRGAPEPAVAATA